MGDRICCSFLNFTVLTKINLARDFGPRLFSWMAGYGTEVWTAGNYYFWVCPVFDYLLTPDSHGSPIFWMSDGRLFV
jgi:hypothetical protein